MARRTNSPWSKTYKEGLPTTAVDDHVNIDRTVVGAITTGVIDSATGQWKGITVTDDAFTIDATHEAVPNSGEVLSPQATPQYIDMTGFNDLQIAIKPSNGGAFAMEAVMGPADNMYTNLTPVNAAAILRGNEKMDSKGFDNMLGDASETMTADVWNIFFIRNVLQNVKLLQFKITNGSGGESDIQFAYLRVV